ncbi:uncharacterized protein CANTADRAFT_19039 [Suhomyces tanzawaensis NRRL Y-17324]|uniref:Uncharacterized protein n=1 Tax=Suhomyces tanzawaensis NRRL Y-17324 TaxID=984487 RepID=A0A1E4SPF1_9ASCO|nr:uncharacterized protein CANTADRAFT_19039 [Suhomyces tanzawaensis NRRL Y-17324]ODV81399.1 hypothetical protein CANTADRAFT_19039 [Suhomyces tanzawaensis NRRL Y-17324]
MKEEKNRPPQEPKELQQAQHGAQESQQAQQGAQESLQPHLAVGLPLSLSQASGSTPTNPLNAPIPGTPQSHSSGLNSGEQELTSPSKSIRNFFRNRASAYSIESISEEPELARNKAKKNSFISLGSELAPSRSPAKSISGGINSLIQLKFAKSRSSITSSASVPPDPNTPDKPTTIDDFADTSSSELSKQDGYDSESINSILDEYEARESKAFTPEQTTPTPHNFVFREEFDESDSTKASLQKRSSVKTIESIGSAANILHPRPPPLTSVASFNRPRPSIDVALSNSYSDSIPTPTSGKRTSGSSSNDSYLMSAPNSATSAKFRFHNDKIEPIMRTNDPRRVKDRAKVISASSNVDVNRSSLMTNMSDPDIDVKYPEPDVTPSQTPLRRPQKTNTDSNPGSSDSNPPHSIQSDPIEFQDSPETQGSNAVKKDEHRLSEVRFADDTGEEVAEVDETALKENTTAYRLLLINSDETALKNSSTMSDDTKRETFRSSLSSGELLNTLENYYDKKPGNASGSGSSVNQLANKSFAPQASSTLRYSLDYPRGEIANLTAGLDSNTELPVMLYKVQDKDYDEGNQRWSVYEHKRASDNQQHKPQKSSDSDSDHGLAKFPPSAPQKLYATGGRSDSAQTFKSAFSQFPMTTSNLPPVPVPSIPRSGSNQDYIDQNFNAHIGDFRRDRPRSVSNKPSLGSLRSPAPPPPAKMRDQPERIFGDKEDGSSSKSSKDSFDLDEIEKQIQDIHQQEPHQKHSHYLVGYFVAMMVLGLIVPPIYFLVSLGVFDSTNTTQQYYPGLANGRGLVKRFSKTQKLVSLALGIFWFVVVLAMIGIGIGLGVTRES